ncbi:sensor histidine kinase [Sulfurihydrogenibium azorense]|uniref:sensor histidine kinase n=1 Tax=Sulfurihydrogenibium azorense TaxID=309806 RepID=UPI00391C4F25
MKINSLKLKLTIQLLFISILLLSVFSFTSYFILENLIDSSIDSEINKKKSIIEKLIQQKDLIQDIDILKDDDIEIVIHDKNEKVVYKTIHDLNTTKKLYEITKKLKENTIESVKIGKNTYRLTHFTIDNYHVIIFKNMDRAIKILDTYNDVLILLYFLTLIFTNGFIYFIVEKNLKNINKLYNDIKEISILDLKPIDSNKYSKEFKEIIEIFNKLLNHIKESYKKEKEFVMTLSHEIKTPITTILADIDITLRKERKKEDYIEALKNIRELAVYMLNIFNVLKNLYISKENFYPNYKSVNLNQVINKVLKMFESDINEKKLSVFIDVDESLNIQTDEVMFQQILQNIASNAIKFNKHSGKLTIKSQKEGNNIKITVSDTGVGISKQELKNIFNEFYKSYNSEGLGLGLSIVKIYSDLLDIKVNIHSQEGEGTTVELILS